MRKSDLLQRIKELIEKNAQLSEKCLSLEKKYHDIKEKLSESDFDDKAELLKQNEALAARVAELEARLSESEQAADARSGTEQIAPIENDEKEETLSPNLFEKIEKEQDLQADTADMPKDTADNEIPEKFRYAADVIERAADLTENLCSKIKNNLDEKSAALLPSVSDKFKDLKTKIIDLVAYNDDIDKIKQKGNAYLNELEGYLGSLQSLI